ncbi:MAG: hypothetical protein K8T91_09165, partial [Planctomycetes bacterium]|nr:hypothetical protein [Planctomycetota bacterium]
GYVGFRSYRYQLERGTPPAKAMRRAVDLNVQGLFGETGILGGLPTGVISNADLAADYLGMKFYLNLREPVTLHGETIPPMLVYENGRLALREDIQRDSQYFAMFVSDHLDEVLNPNLFEANMRDSVRRGVKQNSQVILDRYAGDDPERRSPAYFDQLVEEYSTYYGEYYGHTGQFEKLITVGNTCFDPK